MMMYHPSVRYRMRTPLSKAGAPPAEPGARAIVDDDRPALASLMLDAYRGTVDDAGEGPDEAREEVDRLFSGAYGTLDLAASELVERDGAVVAATIITEFQGRALLAFSMTAPAWKRRGLARRGVQRAMARLREAGREDLWLAVTASNTPALSLYESLGFVRDPA
jgi:ribosomal protein S18 acetylase RimI-like enzyme